MCELRDLWQLDICETISQSLEASNQLLISFEKLVEDGLPIQKGLGSSTCTMVVVYHRNGNGAAHLASAELAT